MIHEFGLKIRLERPRVPFASGLPLWGMIALTGAIVFPPFLYLIKTSAMVGAAPAHPGWGHFVYVFRLSGWALWRVTLLYAFGSACVSMLLGVTSAWLVVRTNAWFRGVAILSAFLSLSAPVMIKAIGWILLLGPNQGLINGWLRSLAGIGGVPINLFTLGGMVAIEGILWAPVVFLLSLPTLTAMDPALEEAAVVAGARSWQILLRVTLPLALPGLLAVLLVTFIQSLESFEIPLLVGTPGNLQTFTTAIYQTIHRGFVPRYGDASAYAVLLILILALPLSLYYRVTNQTRKYATVTGKGFRPSRIDLGAGRIVAGFYLLLLPILLLAPLAILLWASFLPTYEPPQWSDIARMTFRNYQEVLSLPLTLDGLRNGIVVATLAATVVAGFTFVLAWLVVRRREAMRWFLDAIGSLPLVIPGIVLGTALLIEFLDLRFIPIYETVWILVLAFLIRYMPYGIRFCYSGITSIDPQLEESALSCGATAFTMLRRVVLPLALPSVTAIWIYVFVHAIRDLSLPVLLSGPKTQLISVVILDLWNDGSIPEVGALSVLLSLTVTVFGWLLMRLVRRHGLQSF